MSGRQAVWTCLHLEVVLKRANAQREGTNIPLCGIENNYQFGNKHISAIWEHRNLRWSIRSRGGQEDQQVGSEFQRGSPTSQRMFGPNVGERFSFLSVSLGQHPERAQLPAGFTPSPSGYTSTALPSSRLPRWSAAKTLMMQSNKSTCPALYWSITCTSHPTFHALSVSSTTGGAGVGGGMGGGEGALDVTPALREKVVQK